MRRKLGIPPKGSSGPTIATKKQKNENNSTTNPVLISSNSHPTSRPAEVNNFTQPKKPKLEFVPYFQQITLQQLDQVILFPFSTLPQNQSPHLNEKKMTTDYLDSYCELLMTHSTSHHHSSFASLDLSLLSLPSPSIYPPFPSPPTCPPLQQPNSTSNPTNISHPPPSSSLQHSPSRPSPASVSAHPAPILRTSPVSLPSSPLHHPPSPSHPSLSYPPSTSLPATSRHSSTSPAPPPSPPVPQRKTLGQCVVVRSEGATVRDGPDIDNSNVLGRIPFQQIFYFCHSQVLPPPDEECVEVIRLLGYVSQQPQGLFSLPPSQELWISLTGRNIEDHDPIVTITHHPNQTNSNNHHTKTHNKSLK